MSTLDTRLTDLEREVERSRSAARRDRLVAVGLAGVVALLVAGGAAQPGKGSDETRTRKLIIVDENGETRASLGTGMFGTGLSMYDQAGKMRIGLVASTLDGPRAELYDESGTRRAWLGTSKDGPELVLFDEKGEQRVMLFTAKGELGPGLGLFDPEGKVLWRAP